MARGHCLQTAAKIGVTGGASLDKTGLMDEHAAATASGHEIESLKKEMREWVLGIRCVLVVLTLLPLYYCTRVLLAVPSFETIFEDMLGSTTKLPSYTLVVMRFSMPLLLGVWLLAGLGIFLIFFLKRARWVWVVAVLTVFVFTVCGHLVATLLMSPLIAVIQNLSGGSY